MSELVQGAIQFIYETPNMNEWKSTFKVLSPTSSQSGKSNQAWRCDRGNISSHELPTSCSSRRLGVRPLLDQRDRRYALRTVAKPKIYYRTMFHLTRAIKHDHQEAGCLRSSDETNTAHFHRCKPPCRRGRRRHSSTLDPPAHLGGRSPRQIVVYPLMGRHRGVEGCQLADYDRTGHHVCWQWTTMLLPAFQRIPYGP